MLVGPCFRYPHCIGVFCGAFFHFNLRPSCQGKARLVEHPTFYRTIPIDVSHFLHRGWPENGAPVILLLHVLPSSSRMFEPLLGPAFRIAFAWCTRLPGPFGHIERGPPRNLRTPSILRKISDPSPNARPLALHALTCRYGGPWFVAWRGPIRPNRRRSLCQNAVAHNEGLGSDLENTPGILGDRAGTKCLRANLLS